MKIIAIGVHSAFAVGKFEEVISKKQVRELILKMANSPEKAGKEAAFTYWRNGRSVTTQEHSYTEYDNNERMLFDLKKDPSENENIAENPNYKETVERLSQLLANGWENGKQQK